MGVHTGDSITVAPAMTLTDREYQLLRDIGIAVIREVGVDTGGCNIQFAVNPEDGRVIVIEMNPRVSRSSALASKATGFPIAKIAARLAVGYTLDEIPNDITEETPASFEPTLDYVVVKVPRFAFEKFPAADATLTTTMKSVGEAMAIGRNFTEALQKALRSLEKKGSQFDFARPSRATKAELLLAAARAHRRPDQHRAAGDPGRRHASRRCFEATRIDPWFLDQLVLIHELAEELAAAAELDPGPAAPGQAARLLRRPDRRAPRRCARRSSARSGTRSASARSTRPSTPAPPSSPRTTPVLLLLLRRGERGRAAREAGGDHPGLRAQPDRPGHRVRLLLRARLLRAARRRLRDRDGQLQPRDRLHRLRHLRPALLRAAHPGGRAGDRARRAAGRPGRRGDRAARRADPAGPGAGAQGRRRAGRRHLARGDPPRRGPRRVRPGARRGRPARAQARHRLLLPRRRRVADEIGYPVLVRPSYVLGGRGMEIVYDEPRSRGVHRAVHRDASSEHPVLVDRFLDDAIEIDVDALYDGSELYLGGVMEHIEEAGIHSGDSACALPPITLGGHDIKRLRASTEAIAAGVGVRGLINIQFALAGDILYVLEANPRASRTVPFVSKATAVPLAKAAARISLGATDRRAARARDCCPPPATAAPAAGRADLRQGGGAALQPLPHAQGPASTPSSARRCAPPARSWASTRSSARPSPSPRPAAYGALPTKGRAFVSVANRDKRALIFPVQALVEHGFELLATSRHRGGAAAQRRSRHGSSASTARASGRTASRRSSLSSTAGEVDLIVNTPFGTGGAARRLRDPHGPARMDRPCLTTVQALAAAVQGIDALAGRHRRCARSRSTRRCSLGSPAGRRDRGRMTYRQLVRPVLFRLDAERAHHLGLAGLAAASRLAGPLLRRGVGQSPA